MLNKKDSAIVTIHFMGDVMIGRLVNEIIPIKGYAYPWGNMLPLLHNADLRVINLETTLTTHQEKNPKVFNFKALPDRIEILKIANIDVANLANNHSLDFKEAGLSETIAVLDSAHIKHVGAGMNEQEAQQPVVITKNNIKIGIIGYTDNEPTWKATKDKPGVNYIQVGDVQTIKKQIIALRPHVDILIVSSHWGPNMQQKPSQEFIQFAHEIIDAGADIIHGHSSHVFQGIEIYKNKIIMYDTGDFIDDYAVDPMLRNDQSCLFTVTVNKNSPQSVTITPVIIHDMQVNLAIKKEKEDIMKRMRTLSQEFETTMDGNKIKTVIF
jgi:poly-gamma-glutamate synthesis protein (capsule biosynthesis protein)